MVLFFVNNLFLLSYRLDFVGAQACPEADLKPDFTVFEDRAVSKQKPPIKFPSHQNFSLPFTDKQAKYGNFLKFCR